MNSSVDRAAADAILGIDTLWGGDVMSLSGTGRFIADSWFSDEPLPTAYTHPAAAKVRETGGVAAKSIDRHAVEAYLGAVDVHGAIRTLGSEAKKIDGLRGAYLEGLAGCFEVMWDLVMEKLEKGAPVPYERVVRAATGAPPEPSNPAAKREHAAELLARAGYPSKNAAELLAAVDAWRKERMVPQKSIPALASAVIAELEALTIRNVVPYLPAEMRTVPRSNIKFLPIQDAWFSGSMNYLGRARKPDGSPEYEATYEINASLKISVPEFQQLVSHEVVPGHVTTSALIQNLYVRGKLGFEATVLTMNTRNAALHEGIANNGIMMAYGVNEVGELPAEDLQIGVLLALLQDDAKNQSSYLTWNDNAPQKDVERILRNDYLCSEERADKLSNAWGRHPLMGRMYLPLYRAGTEAIAKLRRDHPPGKAIPAMFGCQGLVDMVTVMQAV